jgi:transposase
MNNLATTGRNSCRRPAKIVDADQTWELLEPMSEAELDLRLYGGPKHSRSPSRAEPNPVWIHQELRRTGVTLELLHLEYLAEHPDGFRYTAFCDRYRT